MCKNVISVKKDGIKFFKKLENKEGIFLCTIATTETALIPNISAAGATPELRRYTAQADVEYLYYGKTLIIPDIPKNPLGPPSPVIISKASCNLMNLPIIIIDGGCEVKANVPAYILREKGLSCISTGRAFEGGEELFEKSKLIAKEIAKFDRYVVIGESVPGGTTTALSLLTFLGFDAKGKVSSSMVSNAHDLKEIIVNEAFKNARIDKNVINQNPLIIAERIGDSMQIINAALAIFLSCNVPVILAGGTQMLAVAAYAHVIAKKYNIQVDWSNISVATTRWVLEDEKADFKGLAEQITPLDYVFAADLNFSNSNFHALREYEKGLVKEGVGAGGLATAGFITKSFNFDDLLLEIERLYEEMK